MNYISEKDENPRSYHEAIISKNCYQWKETIKIEFDNLMRIETWELLWVSLFLAKFL